MIIYAKRKIIMYVYTNHKFVCYNNYNTGVCCNLCKVTVSVIVIDYNIHIYNYEKPVLKLW